MPLSNAEICRNYRKRKKEANKLLKISNKVKKISSRKTNAEMCRMYRQRKKMLTQEYQSSTNPVLYNSSTSNSPMTPEPTPLTVSTDPTAVKHDHRYISMLAGVHMASSPVQHHHCTTSKSIPIIKRIIPRSEAQKTNQQFAHTSIIYVKCDPGIVRDRENNMINKNRIMNQDLTATDVPIMHCVIPNCKSESSGHSDRISFHKFPSEPLQRAAWLAALGGAGEPPAAGGVCSAHFLADELCEDGRRLRPGAVPHVTPQIKQEPIDATDEDLSAFGVKSGVTDNTLHNYEVNIEFVKIENMYDDEKASEDRRYTDSGIKCELDDDINKGDDDKPDNGMLHLCNNSKIIVPHIRNEIDTINVDNCEYKSDEGSSNWIHIAVDDVKDEEKGVSIPRRLDQIEVVKVEKNTPDHDSCDEGASLLGDAGYRSEFRVAERLSKNAEKCKNYRKRKKEASVKVKKAPLTPAERSRLYRLRKKQLTQGSKSSENEVLDTPPQPDATGGDCCLDTTRSVRDKENTDIVARREPVIYGSESADLLFVDCGTTIKIEHLDEENMYADE